MSSSFEKHVFISYSHLDNECDTGKEGWVSHLEKTLGAYLTTRLGEKARIWRDPTLRGNDDFADEIVGQFTKAALLVSVISPGYIKSKWCKRELTEFCAAAEKTTGLKIGNRYRVLKIVKLPVDRAVQETLHPAIGRMLGYDFFTGGKEETAIELDPAYAENAPLYRFKVAKLAEEIAEVIKELTGDANGSAPGGPPLPAKASVYLADCAYDRKEERAFLASELKARGYRVLPDSPHPEDRAGYEAEVSRLLGECRLSIHLVGNGYGAVPDGPGLPKSIVILQNELAIERSRAAGLPRIIWLPEGTKPDNSQQEDFIKLLLGDAHAQFGAELITGGFESLKQTVVDTLKKFEAVKPVEAPAGLPLIHIICDERDREATIPLRKFLKSKGFEARIPVFQGEAAAVREANDKVLRDCNAVLVFYGAGEETWKAAVDGELKKLPGYHPDKCAPPIYTWLSAPATAEKSELLELESNILDGLNGFSETALAPLLLRLGAGR